MCVTPSYRCTKCRVFMFVIPSYRCTKYRVLCAWYQVIVAQISRFYVRDTKLSLHKISRFYRTLHIRWVLILALTMSEDGTRGAAATRKGAPSTRRKCEVAGALWFFLHQRNEWHNEATPLNVREPSVSLPAGLCRRQKGETREEGGHMLERSTHSLSKMARSIATLLQGFCAL